MRKLSYVVGKQKVDTLAEAKKIGGKRKMVVEAIAESSPKLTEKQKARRVKI